MRKVRQAPRAAFPNVSQHDVSRCRLAAGTTARVSLAGPSEQKPGKARRSRCTLAILATKAKVSGLWRHTSSYPHLERPLRGEVRPLGLYWRGKPFPMIYRAVDIHFGGGECAQIPCFAMITGRCVCVCFFLLHCRLGWGWQARSLSSPDAMGKRCFTPPHPPKPTRDVDST